MDGIRWHIIILFTSQSFLIIFVRWAQLIEQWTHDTIHFIASIFGFFLLELRALTFECFYSFSLLRPLGGGWWKVQPAVDREKFSGRRQPVEKCSLHFSNKSWKMPSRSTTSIFLVLDVNDRHCWCPNYSAFHHALREFLSRKYDILVIFMDKIILVPCWPLFNFTAIKHCTTLLELLLIVQ